MTPETRAIWMASRTKHGAYVGGKESPEHYTWRVMIDRCIKPNHSAYMFYGARGITVCDRWLQYENFIADMGMRPSSSHSLDRINNDAGYSKENCRWATHSEQQSNKTSTKYYTNNDFTGTLTECAKYLGISKHTAHARWKAWGSFEKETQWQKLQKRS